MEIKVLFMAGFILVFSFVEENATPIIVGTIDELVAANSSAKQGDTIILKDGTYRVASYGIAVQTNNITFRSQSGNREKVIVSGAGMDGNIEYGFRIAGNNVTIKDITIQNVRNHCIQTDVNNDGLHVTNCVLRDAHEQLLKIPSSSSVSDFSENGVVENCLFEFTKGVANQYYTGGVDCHLGKNWIVRNNVFKNIRSPDNQIAEHAIHFWNNSQGSLVENNKIINCDRGIGFGLGDRGHSGGIIRNNMIYHGSLSGGNDGDGGIIIESSPNTQIYNNTIFYENSYPNAIEYRFSTTKGILIQNNLTNIKIQQRDGANGTVSNNITAAQKKWFKDVASGDLHLTLDASDVRDKGISITGLTTDFDGDIRKAGLIDIGADEYIVTGSYILKNKPVVSLANNCNTMLFLKFNNASHNQRNQNTALLFHYFDISGRVCNTVYNKKTDGITIQVKIDDL